MTGAGLGWRRDARRDGHILSLAYERTLQRVFHTIYKGKEKLGSQGSERPLERPDWIYLGITFSNFTTSTCTSL
jgi:hypothetical protein